MQGGETSVVGAARESGYGALVLDRLAVHTCGVVGADGAGVLLRDPRDERFVFSAAGCGSALAQVGNRFELGPGVLRDVPTRARPRRLRSRAEVASLTSEPAPAAASGACVPIRYDDGGRGVVWAVARSGRFERRRARLLSDMAALTAAAIEHAARHERLEVGAEAAVDALAAAIDLRDGYTGEHSAEVVGLAVDVGRALDLAEVELVELACAARLHDVGKLGVPDEVLRKPGPLTPREWTVMRRHARDGAELLARVPGLEAVAAVVRFHHERWDGGGYPDELAGDEIPMASRIVAACDAYGAMTTDRPYRRRLSRRAALDELRRSRGTQFDPQVVDALLAAA